MWVPEPGVTDHGALDGLTDDDHTQYVLADGSRAFTNPVAGVTPTQDAHLATKKYVDDNSGGGGGGGSSNVIGGSDTIPNGESSVEVSPPIPGQLLAAVATPAEIEPIAITAVDPTSFTVERSGSTGDLDFQWVAYIDPTPYDIWSDAMFLWVPNHGDRSKNLVGGGQSDSGLNEGSEVTQDGRPGREYSGAVGSRFPVASFDIRPPSDTTIMAVISADSGTGTGLWLGIGTDTNQYANLGHNQVGWRSDGAGSAGSSDWPTVAYTLSSGLAVVIGRFTSTGATTGTLEAWMNGVAGTPGAYSTNNALSVNRITVGRTDDSSPSNSSGIRVFAAAVWQKALNAGEIATILDDPYAYMS